MPRRMLFAVVTVVAAGSLSACGKESVSVSKSDPTYKGAQLFAQRCQGCHTLDVAGTQGGATKVRDRERTDGPNFNVRKETVSQALYAIRNGGFSGAIMPENIVVGKEALEVAQFLAKFSGRKAPKSASPNG